MTKISEVETKDVVVTRQQDGIGKFILVDKKREVCMKCTRQTFSFSKSTVVKYFVANSLLYWKSRNKNKFTFSVIYLSKNDGVKFF